MRAFRKTLWSWITPFIGRREAGTREATQAEEWGLGPGRGSADGDLGPLDWVPGSCSEGGDGFSSGSSGATWSLEGDELWAAQRHLQAGIRTACWQRGIRRSLSCACVKHFSGSLFYFMVVWSLFLLSAEAETAGEAERPAMGFTAAGAGQAAGRGGEKSERTGERQTSKTGPIQPGASQRAAGTVRLKFTLISACCICSACDYHEQSCIIMVLLNSLHHLSLRCSKTLLSKDLYRKQMLFAEKCLWWTQVLKRNFYYIL